MILDGYIHLRAIYQAYSIWAREYYICWKKTIFFPVIFVSFVIFVCK